MTIAYQKAIESAKTLGRNPTVRALGTFGLRNSHLSILTSQLRNELQVMSAAIEVLPKGTTPRLDAEEALSHILSILEALES